MIDQGEIAGSAGEGATEEQREPEKAFEKRSVCTVMLVETWTSGLGSKHGTPNLNPRPTITRSCQTVTGLRTVRQALNGG